MNDRALMPYYDEGYHNTAIDVLNGTSDINYLYQISVPFQITYEYCSGTNPDDYLNIITMSENGVFYSQELIRQHNYMFHNKPAHTHDYYEFMLVLEGSLIQKIENNEYLYASGSCCLINRNLKHKETFNQASRILFLGFSVNFISKLFDSYTSAYFKEESSFKNTLLYQFVIKDIKNLDKKTYLDFIPTYQNKTVISELHDLCEDLFKNMMFPKFGTTFTVSGLLCTILYYISSPGSYHCTCVKLDNSSDYLLFAHIKHLIEENEGRISRHELALKLNYSADYLNRIVHKYTGMCLHDYGMTFILKKAADYLINTDESISSIALHLQFMNRTYFYKLFKEKYGMTPKEFRKVNQVN